MRSLIVFIATALCILPAVAAAPAVDLEARQCEAPLINEAALKLITESEGFSPNAYWDQVQWAIGHGHKCVQDHCAEIKPQPINEAQAAGLMQDDLKTFRDTITMGTGDNVRLNENEYGALVSFAYNAGPGNVEDSGLLKRLNAGENPQVVIESVLRQPAWTTSNGEFLKGLADRRNNEVLLAKRPTRIGVLPVPCLMR